MIDENKAIIIGFNDFEYEGDLVITNQLDDYTVTGIGRAFAYRSTLTACATIPDTVTTVEYRAFTELCLPHERLHPQQRHQHRLWCRSWCRSGSLAIRITVLLLICTRVGNACSAQAYTAGALSNSRQRRDPLVRRPSCRSLRLPRPHHRLPGQPATAGKAPSRTARPSPTSPWQRTTRTMPAKTVCCSTTVLPHC